MGKFNTIRFLLLTMGYIMLLGIFVLYNGLQLNHYGLGLLLFSFYFGIATEIFSQNLDKK